MYKKILLPLSIFIALANTHAIADGRYVINGNYDFNKTDEQIFTNNRCSRGYSKLKKMLKDEAKSYCASQGSHGLKILRMKKWTKISCVKNRSRNSRTTVTIKGNYRALCD